MATLTIPNDEINKQVDERIKELGLVTKDELTGRTWGINKFRKECCMGKPAIWVRTFIFDEYPEVLFENGGWCVAPHKTPGIKGTKIFAYDACKWMQKHQHDIDWFGKVEQ